MAFEKEVAAFEEWMATSSIARAIGLLTVAIHEHEDLRNKKVDDENTVIVMDAEDGVEIFSRVDARQSIPTMVDALSAMLESVDDTSGAYAAMREVMAVVSNLLSQEHVRKISNVEATVILHSQTSTITAVGGKIGPDMADTLVHISKNLRGAEAEPPSARVN
jgi:hypothetical protein